MAGAEKVSLWHTFDETWHTSLAQRVDEENGYLLPGFTAGKAARSAGNLSASNVST
jgi:hypothetical protein